MSANARSKALDGPPAIDSWAPRIIGFLEGSKGGKGLAVGRDPAPGRARAAGRAAAGPGAGRRGYSFEARGMRTGSWPLKNLNAFSSEFSIASSSSWRSEPTGRRSDS